MVYEGKRVWTPDDFDYSEAKVGDLVDAAVVMDAMNCLPPACMRLNCAQIGEPYSHRFDDVSGQFRPTFTTFRCVEGDFGTGVWEYRGHCFFNETTERGKDPAYM